MSIILFNISFASAAIPIEIFPLTDTYVIADLNDPDDVGGLRDKNFGTSTSIEVLSGWKEKNSQKIWSQAYLTFDLQAIPEQHSQVTLNMKAKDIILPDGPKKLVLVQITYTDWSETEVTYNTQPPQGEAEIIIAETLVTTDKYDYEFDITDFVDTYESQELSVALRFEKLDDVGYVSFYSKEAEDNLSRPFLRPHIFTADTSIGPGGCLIATATYGSELAPQVQMLREIRDNIVLSTHSGTSFMTAFNTFYYSFSPTIADLERQNPVFKETIKIAITPLLSSLSLLQYVDIDSEEEMLGYGISIILLNVGMYFVTPIVLGKKIVKSLRTKHTHEKN